MRRWIWILPVGLALLIVWLSHQPRLPLGITWPEPFDKLAHAGA